MNGQDDFDAGYQAGLEDGQDGRESFVLPSTIRGDWEIAYEEGYAEGYARLFDRQA